MDLLEYLQNKDINTDLIKVFLAFEKSVDQIAEAIQYSDGTKAGSTNVHGEDQLALDIQADNIMTQAFEDSGLVNSIASEEKDDVLKLANNGRYAVAFDPLDGSSLVNVNFAVGSILAVFEGDSFIGKTPRDMVAAAYACYGPRTTIVLSVGDGSHEFTFQDGVFVLTRENLQVAEKAKTFAPGNLRAAASEDWYKQALLKWIDAGYKLRYSGGMVPDINHILVKGQGIFTYPGYVKAPDGKLRLLIECGPMAYLVEQAGGAATDGKISILDKTIQSIDQRTPIFIGSKEEVCQIQV